MATIRATTDRVSLRDVARVANVSKSTASLVLNKKDGRIPLSEGSIDRVREAARQLGYKPNVFARGLVTGRSRLHALAVVLANEDCLNSEVNSQVMAGVTTAAARSGYVCSLVMPQRGGDQNLQDHPLFAERLVEGVVAVQWESVAQDYLSELEEKDIPFVAVHMELAEQARGRVASVNADDFNNGYKAAEHLVACGYREIVFVGGPPDSDAAVQRQSGVRKCLEDDGRSLDTDRIVAGTYMDVDRGQFEKLMGRFDQSIGVVAVSDYLAASLIKWTRQLKLRIPEDVGIVGFDDEYYASRLEPALSTVRLHGFEEGELAAKMVIDMITGKDVQQKEIVVPGKLIARASTGQVLQ